MRVISPPIIKVIDSSDYLGETPIWSNAQHGIYWINCERPPRLQYWHLPSGERATWLMPRRIGGFVLKRQGGALLALADGLYDFRFEDRALSRRTVSPLNGVSLHECRCDPTGRVWVGSFDSRVRSDGTVSDGGFLFRLEGTRLVPMLSRITCSNGLAFSPDGETLYHTDSPSRVVYAWTLHPATGALSHRREFARLEAGDGYCDGATVDAEGGYWMALVFGSKIRRYLPDGSLDLEIKLPFANPTNVAFGGVGYATLFVTTTQMSLGPGAVDSGMLGNVYSLECGFHGMPEPRFEG